jgi:cytidyltransferase-like protein
VNSKEPRQPRRLGVYAGSFDSLTVGHQLMIQEGVRLFEHLIVAVGTRPDEDQRSH